MDWMGLAEGYLEAEGWEVMARGRDLLRGDRSGRGDDEKDYVYVWIPVEAGSNLSSREGPFLRRFEEAKEEHPTAEMVFLVPTVQGLSSDFRSGARRWHGVKILVPAQFFDSEFRWERDSRTASATKELHSRGDEIARERIAQPYRIIRSPNSRLGMSGSDLLDVLRQELGKSMSVEDRPTIHVVVGPAGMGKSYLFASLYGNLYRDFQSNKRGQHLSARPFALLPEQIYDASAPTIGSLLDAYLRTEFARPMDRDMFNWKLINGLGVWLLDGLDEILERDPKFFDYLEELLTDPSGVTRPSVVICIRDSLFATHRELNAFCEEVDDFVVVYQLEGWQRQSKYDLARRQLRSEARATEFAESLDANPSLDELASTPYYCELLVEEYDAGGIQSGNAETDILERGIERIVQRERDKGLVLGISNEDVREFIESCAAFALFDGGIPAEDVREMAEVMIPDSAGEDELSSLVTQMGQIALFAQGYDGRLRFAQESLEHYLAANHLAHSLQRDSRGDLRTLGRCELPDDVLRLMSFCLDSDSYGSVYDLLIGKMHEDSTTGRNALRLVVRMAVHTEGLSGISLSGLNLSGMAFEDHVMRDMSFDGADLTNTDFRGVDLAGASFNNCLIRGTRFDADKAKLRNVHFDEMHRFHSAYIGDDFVDDLGRFGEFLGGSQRTTEAIQLACGAAQQLRYLFGKFVAETGRARRKDLPRAALLRGKRIVPHREQILDEAIRARYLVEFPSRDRISRAGDESYREIVDFRKGLEMSSGIRALLDAVCKETDCPHVR